MPTGPFSGGEKSRLALALLVYRRPNLLLLDEPTNHLDIEMRQALAVSLQDFDGAMMIVSHDRHLLRVTCDTLLLVHGGAVDEFPGSLDDYPRWLAEQNREERRGEQDEAERRRQLTPLKKRLTRAEESLAALESRRDRLQTELADENLYDETKQERLKALLAEQADVERDLASAEAEWLAAADALDSLNEGTA
jgi:ATP-binding cassette subfamily F protein 3